MARNDDQAGDHKHAYAQTGRTEKSTVKRGRKNYELTIYEMVCPVKDCPRPTIWSEPHEREI